MRSLTNCRVQLTLERGSSKRRRNGFLPEIARFTTRWNQQLAYALITFKINVNHVTSLRAYLGVRVRLPSHWVIAIFYNFSCLTHILKNCENELKNSSENIRWDLSRRKNLAPIQSQFELRHVYCTAIFIERPPATLPINRFVESLSTPLHPTSIRWLLLANKTMWHQLVVQWIVWSQSQLSPSSWTFNSSVKQRNFTTGGAWNLRIIYLQKMIYWFEISVEALSYSRAE